MTPPPGRASLAPTLALLTLAACARSTAPLRSELVHQATLDAHLRALAALPDGTLVAAGFEGRAARSTDAGATWAAVPTGTTLHLYGAAASPGGDCWLVGERGLVLHARDRARTFRAEPTPTSARLTAAVAAPGPRVTAVGDGGLVLERRHGAWSIRVEARPATAGLRAVAPLGERLLAVGYDGLAMRETATGTWEMAEHTRGGDASYGLAPGPDGRLFSCGSFGALQYTSDGTTWTPVPSGTRAFLRGASFHDDFGIAVGLGTIVATTDGGSTWGAALEGHPAQLLAAVALPHGAAVAAGEHGTILRTTDYGHHFTEVATPSYAFSSVSWPERSLVLAAGESTLRSTDGGATFAPVAGARLARVSMWDGKAGLAISAGRALHRTTDGGASWLPAAGPGNLQLVVCLPPARAMAAGPDGTFWSEDGGTTWSAGRSPARPANDAVNGGSDSPAWLVGGDGLLATCRKPGGPWLALYTGLPGVTLEGVALAGEHLYAVGESGVALASTQRGRGSSLSLRRLPGAPHLRAVATSAEDPSMAIAVGDGGTACVTTDGGHRWRCQSLHPTARLVDVAMRGRHAIAVGDGGRIYRLSF